MSVPVAWKIFGEKNGDPTRARFEERIAGYRRRFDRAAQDQLSCLVLRDAVFLPRNRWLPWSANEEWQRQTS